VKKKLFSKKLIGVPVGIREFPDTRVLIMQLQQHFLGKMFWNNIYSEV